MTATATATTPVSTGRTTETEILPLFLERWSPRAFDAQPLAEGELRTLLDAARWAPSAYNVQPWRFLYAERGTPDWDRFLSILVPFNQSWAQNASVLMIVLSDTLMFGDDPEKAHPSHSHSFDAGAAWAHLALQATALGLQAHGMTGIDFDRARTELGVPERFRVEAAIAVGRPTDASTLPEPMRSREVPSNRKAVDEVAYPGNFRG